MLLDKVTADAAGARRAGDQLGELFAEWYAARDERVHTGLDSLAMNAPSNESALEVLLILVDRHGLARPALRRILLDPEDLDNAEQSTLAVVGMKIAQYNGAARFLTWLHQVASNEAKLLIRSRDRRPSSAVAEPPVAPFVARLSTILADRDVVERALGELPADFRRPLELREVDGLDYAEIAAVLEVPVGTVRSRLSRARTALMVSLRAELDEVEVVD